MIRRQFTFTSLAETTAFGQALGPRLFAGAVVGLNGELGAGKTHLVRAICTGLGVRNLAAVTSPTYTLVHEYAGRLPVFHFDAYRLRTPREFADLGVDEYLAAGGVCLVEWAERVAEFLPADRLDFTLIHAGPTTRNLDAAAGPRHAELLTSDPP